MRWQEARPTEADNIDVGPATETDLQGDLIEASGDPFYLGGLTSCSGGDIFVTNEARTL
jgi:hypothetical protein